MKYVLNYLRKFEDKIKTDLHAALYEKPRCKAVCKSSGQCCRFSTEPDSNVCKKHKNIIIEERNVPDLLYHCHLPGQFIESCSACQTVGINS